MSLCQGWRWGRGSSLEQCIVGADLYLSQFCIFRLPGPELSQMDSVLRDQHTDKQESDLRREYDIMKA